MADMVLVAGLDGRIVTANEIFCHTLDYSVDELRGLSIADLHPAEKGREVELCLSSLLHGECRDCRLPLRTKNGDLVPVVSRAWFGSWDGADCIYGTCRNLSDEQELEQRFERLFRHNPALMALSTVDDQRFVDVNESWLEATGYSLAEVIGRTSRELGLFPCPEQHEQATEQLRRHGRISNIEMQIRCKDGTLRHGLFSGEQIRSHGRFSFLTVMIDITERKQAEQLLRTTLERVQIILSSLHTGILLVNSEDRVEFVNPAFCELFALDEQPADLIGLSSPEIIRKVEGMFIDPVGATDRIREIIARQQPVQNELIAIKGERSYLRDFIPITIGQTKYGRLWHHSDISERKRAEEALEKRMIALVQPLDSTDDLAIDDLFNLEQLQHIQDAFARDFNNILGAVIGYADMAWESVPPGSPVARDLEQILKAGNRAKDLVQQILAFSRQAATEPVTLYPALIVKEVLKMLRPSLPSTIAIEQQIDSTAGPVHIDPTQLHQILMNLCTNAYHAMEETGGTLTLALTIRQLDAEEAIRQPQAQTGTYVQLTVADTGSGIAPEIRKRIFDPFFTTKETGKGTGMGLSILHGIVTSNGGFITLDSAPGQGSVFRVHLPVATPVPVAERTQSEPAPVGSEHILFIDDEEILTTMTRTILERLGYRVTVRTSSLEALTTFHNQPGQFDLVITDQTMPGMTGLDLARRMIQIRSDIPIILCTGYSTQISEEKARAHGIRGFALKPITKKDLATLIRTALTPA